MSDLKTNMRETFLAERRQGHGILDSVEHTISWAEGSRKFADVNDETDIDEIARLLAREAQVTEYLVELAEEYPASLSFIVINTPSGKGAEFKHDGKQHYQVRSTPIEDDEIYISWQGTEGSPVTASGAGLPHGYSTENILFIISKALDFIGREPIY